jgi:hypothetical protein
MNPHSQNESILKASQLGESITQRDAIERWNCYRLSGRIFDLRHGVYDGVSYDIEEVSERNADGRGKHARYRLRKSLADLVDNSTTVVTIQTPKGWRCSRPGCRSDIKHTHGVYPSLLPPAFSPKVEQKQDSLF